MQGHLCFQALIVTNDAFDERVQPLGGAGVCLLPQCCQRLLMGTAQSGFAGQACRLHAGRLVECVRVCSMVVVGMRGVCRMHYKKKCMSPHNYESTHLVSHGSPQRITLLLQVAHAGVHGLAFLCKATQLVQLPFEVGDLLLATLFLGGGSFQGTCFPGSVGLFKLLQLPRMLDLCLLVDSGRGVACARRVRL